MFLQNIWTIQFYKVILARLAITYLLIKEIKMKLIKTTVKEIIISQNF